MCGIAGVIDTRQSIERLDSVLQRMHESMSHRGPDDFGIDISKEQRVGLTHRRLSIQDPSPDGHQPMTSASGRYTTVFNGEIYNFMELRKDLEASGARFRGHSDTEVLLEMVQRTGFEQAVKQWDGMFAIAVLDRQDKKLFLSRDRLGKKPLAIFQQGGLLAFASELQCFECIPAFQLQVSTEAARQYFRLGYVPAPLSIAQGVVKVLPGEIVTIEFGREELNIQRQKYWSVTSAYREAQKSPIHSMDEAKTTLRSVLERATRNRMISDVPLGAFLSGGIDSSLVVAMMQSIASQPVRTFTVRFGEQGFDESVHAKAVAEYLGTDHTEITVEAQDAMAIIPRLSTIYDEPFGDSSQVPTSILCEVTRKEVTVALSGDGGDEAFLGYSRYAFALETWQRLSKIPRPFRQIAASGLRALPASVLGLMAAPLKGRVPDFGRNPLGVRIKRGAELIDFNSYTDLYVHLLCKYRDGLVRGLESDAGWQDEFSLAAQETTEKLVGMGLIDAQNYLPDDILVKVDRASMATSLEVRSPLMDHHVFETAWSMSTDLKHDGHNGKSVLKQLAYSMVPQEILDRPKMGFGIPLDNWLRGPLSNWANDLINVESAMLDDLIDRKRVNKMWQEHKSGKCDWHAHIWLVLMFNAWAQEKGVL